MGLKEKEKILVISDILTVTEWISLDYERLLDAIKRVFLAKTVSEIAKEKFPECNVEFFVYPSVGQHGAYPGRQVEDKMKTSDVVIAITTYSLTHTDARVNACKAGARVASMPGFTVEMFYPDGPMTADYHKIAKETRKIAEILTEANEATVKSDVGTDVSFSLKGREGLIDDGLITEKGSYGNLPAGEAFIAPVERTAHGRVVIEAGCFPRLKENMILEFENGYVVKVSGGGEIGNYFRELLSLDVNNEPFLSRRSLAELGVGTNPNARRPDNVLEAEKIRGTVHIAIGDNSHMGGLNKSDIHQDFVIFKPTLILDGKIIMKDGRLKI